MTWFQFYATFGAPVLLFVVCLALIKVERRQRRRRLSRARAINATGDLFGKRVV